MSELPKGWLARVAKANHDQVSRWPKELKEAAGFDIPDPRDARIDELEAENARLAAELDDISAARAAQQESDRAAAISFVLGNLNSSTNHNTTREIVKREYDQLHPKE